MQRRADEEPFDVDRLYGGLTRPPMLKGVTDVYAVFLMVAGVTLYIGVGGGKGLLYAASSLPALYIFGYLMCLKDPRIFTIWQVRMRYLGLGRRRSGYWGGSSFDPF